MATCDEYINAITGGNTTRRQEVLAIIAEHCQTITPDEQIVIETFFESENYLSSLRNLKPHGIYLKREEYKGLLQIVLRPIALELGIRITGEQTGNAAEIIATARRRYKERTAARAGGAARNPNETRGRPPEVKKVLPETDSGGGFLGRSTEIRHTFFPEARADAAPEPVSEKSTQNGEKQ